MRALPDRPDMQRLLACARAILDRVDAHGLGDAVVLARLEAILFAERQAWACAAAGILTEDEVADLILAHLDTLVERACGRSFDHRADDTPAMRRALFGS